MIRSVYTIYSYIYIGSKDATSNHPTVYLAGTTAHSQPSSFDFGYPDFYPITAVKGVTYSNPIAISRTEQVTTTGSRWVQEGKLSYLGDVHGMS